MSGRYRAIHHPGDGSELELGRASSPAGARAILAGRPGIVIDSRYACTAAEYEAGLQRLADGALS